ncbi:hypothetical protein PVAG01_04453 [Phlyctema vagabunda]|uniref:Uncharacterized protein n=1 Tax=Phlyctema vagabunda TaxID=108571 RepID=A0ABR4PP83_9HELO
MTPDEAAVFIQYDTHPLNKKFNRIGHTAFRNELARPGCPPRQSVEARILVLSPPPYENEITLDNPPAPESRVQPWKKFVQVAPRVKAVASGKERKMQFGYKPEAAQAIKV